MFDIKQIRIFALAAYGKGLSGGDRIFIEFARRWSKNFPVEIYVWKEGDVGGDALQKTVISKFAFDCRIFICSCPKDKDPGDLNIDQLKHIFDNRQNWFKRKKCKVVVSYLQ